MNWLTKVRTAALLVAALAVAACSELPQAPGPVSGADQTSSGGLVQQLLSGAEQTVGYVEGWSSDNYEELLPILQREQERIATIAATSETVNVALIGSWLKLLTCEPLTYAADARILGPAGGELRVGPHRMVVPSGALRKWTVVVGEMPASGLVEVKLSPHGLRFRKDVALSLSYQHCNTPLVRLPYRMVYIDDFNQPLEWPKSKDDQASKTLNGWIKHFSRYAVVAN